MSVTICCYHKLNLSLSLSPHKLELSNLVTVQLPLLSHVLAGALATVAEATQDYLQSRDRLSTKFLQYERLNVRSTIVRRYAPAK